MGAGLKDFKVLKTTQSGYEGYLRDQYTLLPETRERIMASSVTASWKCAQALSYPDPLRFAQQRLLLMWQMANAMLQHPAWVRCMRNCDASARSCNVLMRLMSSDHVVAGTRGR